MLLYIVRRFVSLFFILVAATSLTFIMGKFAPGDPIQIMMGRHHDVATLMRLRHIYGLDLPWLQQYGLFLWRALHGNLGYSYHWTGTEVTTILYRQVPVSVQLGLISLVLSILLGVPLGIIAAVKERRLVDHGVLVLSMAFYTIPNFVFIPYLWILDKVAGYPLPVAGWSWATPATVILPILSVVLGVFGYFVFLARTTMLEVLRQDYIRTARAKGLSERAVVYSHALRNALLPLVTYSALSLAFVVVGQFVTELFFNVPGVGVLTLNSVIDADYPVVQGTVILLSLSVVVVNFLTDIAYGLLDPRVRTA